MEQPSKQEQVQQQVEPPKEKLTLQQPAAEQVVEPLRRLTRSEEDDQRPVALETVEHPGPVAQQDQKPQGLRQKLGAIIIGLSLLMGAAGGTWMYSDKADTATASTAITQVQQANAIEQVARYQHLTAAQAKQLARDVEAKKATIAWLDIKVPLGGSQMLGSLSVGNSIIPVAVDAAHPVRVPVIGAPGTSQDFLLNLSTMGEISISVVDRFGQSSAPINHVLTVTGRKQVTGHVEFSK